MSAGRLLPRCVFGIVPFLSWFSSSNVSALVRGCFRVPWLAVTEQSLIELCTNGLLTGGLPALSLPCYRSSDSAEFPPCFVADATGASP